ncbi:nuclear transport factor 2 family protein [Oceanicoccus sagamiensis]|uniref:SnoaL-like domain-containing protein n=1 Tax=Oceanicoccus sagamiensis TaxID=716816 RepID=A0A1X9NH38_9GAMM|nr:nuclear transport factor 2 family protein [Oceanicoccus sagamiensis]ARN75712.1 hypothetical protein BST96_17315 [Oceanicoccus sagamiensis]
MSSEHDRTALQDLMLRYAAGVDERDYDLYASCFAEQLEVVGFGEKSFNSKEAWLDYVWTALKGYGETQHMLGPQLATIEGDTAQTRNDVQAFHSLLDQEAQHFILWATYKTEMKKFGGAWKITRHELVVRGTQSQ